MRKFLLAFSVVALVAVIGVSAIGQQQPPYAIPGTEATLTDAARTNNFPLFDALYAQGGDDAARFAELHAFWKWSMTDPVGGFYGDEVHAKLAREYPDYAEYIADYGIIDANGRAYYPSAETRVFLLKHVLDGTAPVIRVAQKRPATKPAHRVVARFSAPSPRHGVLKHAAPLKPVVTRTVATVQPKVVVVPQVVSQQPQPKPEPAPQAPVSDDRLAHGFALIVAGLVAAGMLTLMLHTPKETV